MAGSAKQPPVPDSKYVELAKIVPKLSQVQMAAMLGVSKASVSKRLKKLGLNEGLNRKKRMKEVIKGLEPQPSPETAVVEILPLPLPSAQIRAQMEVEVSKDRGLMDQLIAIRNSIDLQSAVLAEASDEVDAALPKLKIAGLKDASMALKNMTQISDTTMQIHDMWAENSMETLNSFAQRSIQRLSKSSDITNVRAVLHDEFSNARDTMAKHYRDVNPSGVNR